MDISVEFVDEHNRTSRSRVIAKILIFTPTTLGLKSFENLFVRKFFKNTSFDSVFDADFKYGLLVALKLHLHGAKSKLLLKNSLYMKKKFLFSKKLIVFSNQDSESPIARSSHPRVLSSIRPSHFLNAAEFFPKQINESQSVLDCLHFLQYTLYSDKSEFFAFI